MLYHGIVIEKINHSAIRVRGKNIVIYFDPFMLGDGTMDKADIICVSHEHHDHCSPEDIKKIIKNDTVIVTINAVPEILKDLSVEKIILVKPGDNIEVMGVKIEAAPAYNINKFRSPGVPFHPPQDGKVGFVVEIDGVRIYHAGDTDNIPEMKNLKNIDVAFLPVSGIFAMTAAEAAEATSVINPKLAVPIHYGDFSYQGNPIGSKDDGLEFKKLCAAPVEII